tara:strand:+ start:1993 stop:2301 length:309 start_codon:yes stop_codon:yes gene_type:complete
LSYYNTTNLKGYDLKEARRKTNTQEDRILTFFEKNADKAFSPEEIQTYCMMANRPLTSVRRAITNLTKEGYLRKTSHMKQGNYGKPVHTWQFKQSTPQEELW